MRRSLVAIAVVAVLAPGCVSIAPAAPAARPSPPSPSVSNLPAPASSVPTVSPTPVPTVTPAALPTPAPTRAPQASTAPTPPPSQQPPATPHASPAGVENYGASTPLINDGFEDSTSGWGVGTNDGGSVAYASGSLQIDVKGGHSWEWTRRLTGATSNAVHIETEYTPTGSGELGLLCASSDDELWGAAANEQGHYRFIRVTRSGASVLSEGQLDSLQKPAFAFARFALDCAGTDTPSGRFKMQLYAPGANVGVQLAPVAVAPRSFDRVGIYVESSDVPFSVAVDALLAFGGTGDTSMSADARELLTHVPGDWQPLCFESFASAFVVGAKGDVLCQLKGGRSDYAEYTSFDNQADMDASFQSMVTRWGVPETGVNCDSGAHLGGYSVRGQPAGRILCAPAVTGTQFFWTDDSKLIMGQLIDLEGSYADMYQDWLNAGPN